MVIREILDGFDKLIANARKQCELLEGMKGRILACCKEEQDGRSRPVAGRVGCEEPSPKPRKRKAA